MPRYPIARSTNFIIEDESWQVVEYDHTSVPGTIYLSLTENKINLIYDDTENNIADMDKLAKYSLALPESKQIFAVGSVIKPNFTIMKNGKPYETDQVVFLPADGNTKVVDGQLIAKVAGETTINVQLKDYPDIKMPMTITIGEDIQEFDAYIEGPDFIRLARKGDYVLKNIAGDIVYPTSCTLALTDATRGFATIVENRNEDDAIESWTIYANELNKITTEATGKIKMVISYYDKEYTKDISIIPLW